MDNFCHTLVGAVVGEAGLNRRTRFGNATLMIAANLPDIDVLVFASSVPAVALRRGWTHGIAALVVLPIALTAMMLLVARIRPTREGGRPVRATELLLLSYVGVISHVFLDLLNNYGVRLLAPFDWRWFYGDSLFIIDPWLWLTCGLGVWFSARRRARSSVRSVAPARVALVVAVLYIAAMCFTAQMARKEVLEAWRAVRSSKPLAAMVGPVAVSPFRRTVIIDAGDHYETGTFTWFPKHVTLDAVIVPKSNSNRLVARARETARIQAFLIWSRFPFWTLEEIPEGMRVTVSDLRFGGRSGMFAQRVVVR